jgi:Uma2 family endonuclease
MKSGYLIFNLIAGKPMSTAQQSVGRHLVLYSVDWRTYTRLLRLFADRRGLRLTYDRGVLEIMSPLFEHEIDEDLLGRFVAVLTEELRLPIQSGGSTTLRRRRLKRGLEPDRCWWIANAPRMQGRRKLDLRTDPPPDLAIEIDVTRSSIKRLNIYAALGIPEVWRVARQQLTFNLLQPNRKYAAGESLSFPGLKPEELLPFLALRAQADENEVVRQFRAWVQAKVATGRWPPQPPPLSP